MIKSELINIYRKDEQYFKCQNKPKQLNDQIQLNIETGKPGILVGDLGSGLETVLTNVKRNYHQIVNSQLTFWK
jgi:ABC-type proline/glycine betaine transport system ATPase subunit